jgi:hypothetical protein
VTRAADHGDVLITEGNIPAFTTGMNYMKVSENYWRVLERLHDVVGHAADRRA